MNFKEDIQNFCMSFNTTLGQVESFLEKIVGETDKYFETKKDGNRYLEHIYFATIALTQFKIDNILEIGTGLGVMSNLFSKLFPQSHIYTLDLPKKDERYNELAERKRNNREEFCENNTNRSNITFTKQNSFVMNLLNMPQRWDLIWVDGGHSYPSVAWDIFYAYGHIRTGGFVFMHDYGKPHHDVTKVVDYINKMIPEKIHFLPFTGKQPNYKTCYFRKL